MKWPWSSDEKPTRFAPVHPRNGVKYVPPTILRKYRMIVVSMRDGDRAEVYRLQLQLAESNYQVPSTVEEAREILRRLKRDVAHHYKGSWS